MDVRAANQRSRFRMGIVITGMAAIIISVALAAPPDGSWLWWLALAALAATGIGLLFDARFARLLAGLMMVAGAVLAPLSLVSDLARVAAADAWDASLLWSVANAVASTVLLIWLCVRGVLVLVGTRRASLLTARIVGGVLAVIAANHLWLARQIGDDGQGMWSISLSPQGAQLVGFPGWPLWHLVLLVLALMLLVGSRRMLHIAATVLPLLFAGQVLLMIVAVARTGPSEPVLLLSMLGMALLPTYLCWWLRDEIRSQLP